MMLSTILAVAEGGGGLNPFDPAAGGGLLWTWVIFLGALPFMWKIVLGPVSRALNDRDELAARKIAEAEQASADAEQSRAEVEVKLGEARLEAQKLLADARERAGVREREIVEAAQADASGLLENARKTIQVEKQKAISEIRDTVVDISMDAAARVLERNVGSEDDRRMVAGLVSQMKDSG